MSPSTHLISEPGPLMAAEHYRSIFDAMLNGLAYCKVLTEGPPPHDFVYIEVNDAFETLTGLKDVGGKKASEVIPGIREQDPWLLNLYSEVARTGQPRKFESYVKALGEWFAVSVYSPAKDHFVAVFDVTTKAKAAEEALRASEELFRTTFENSSIGKALMAPTGRPIRVNRTICEMLGYPEQELLAANWRDLTHPDDLEATAKEIERATKNPRDGGRLEKRYIRNDGTELWADESTRAVFIGGEVKYFVTTIVDITKRKQAEIVARHLREQEQAEKDLLSALLESIGDEVWFCDIEGRFTLANRASLAEFKIDLGNGVSVEELARSLEVLRPDGTPRPVEEAPPLRALRGEVVMRQEEIIRTPATGTFRHRQVTATPVRDRSGKVIGSVSVVRDVTETHALQAKVALASRLAALGTLVSGVAHEINNPLAAELADQGLALEVVHEVREHLRGDSPLDRVADGRALDGVVEALEDAKESGVRISRIVRDLSMFGKPDAKRQRTRLMDIVDGAIRWLPVTDGGSASVQVENVGAPEVIVSAGQLEQILVNLITNAAKATPDGQRGTVTVRLGPGLPGMARVEVIDHGIGIDPAIRDRIFDPFFTTRPSGPGRGSGLGLAICQAIATAHGGAITFESEVGKGTTFRLELPAAPVEA